ncbi:MAG: hypothetical protein ACR2PR_01720 [Pseudohongiellaceae bacterium]
MEQRRVVRVMNDVRAMEALADVAKVHLKNIKRSLKFALRDSDINPDEVNIDVLDEAVAVLDAAADAVHSQLNIVANAHGVHVPEDNEDGGIIVQSGGSKGGGG